MLLFWEKWDWSLEKKTLLPSSTSEVMWEARKGDRSTHLEHTGVHLVWGTMVYLEMELKFMEWKGQAASLSDFHGVIFLLSEHNMFPDVIFSCQGSRIHPGASQPLNSVNSDPTPGITGTVKILIISLQELQETILLHNVFQACCLDHLRGIPLSEYNWTTSRHQTLHSETIHNSREPMSRNSMSCDNILYSNY